MAKEEEYRHERQALYGYVGQANAGIAHNIKRGAGTNVPSMVRTRDKLVADEAQQEERELSNRVWEKEEVVELHKAVEV